MGPAVMRTLLTAIRGRNGCFGPLDQDDLAGIASTGKAGSDTSSTHGTPAITLGVGVEAACELRSRYGVARLTLCGANDGSCRP